MSVLINLLIDENLSPSLVQKLSAKGFYAQHVAHIGMAGWTDPQVWLHAYENDQVVVTLNVADFLHLAETGDLHPGLIVLRESGLSREEQWKRLEPVVDCIAQQELSLVNKVVEVHGIGRFDIRDLPKP